MSSARGFPGQRISKKLMLRVRPGIELVRASFVPTSELITLDLPTFERPRKAISGKPVTGNCAGCVAAARKRPKILILKFATAIEQLASWYPKAIGYFSLRFNLEGEGRHPEGPRFHPRAEGSPQRRSYADEVPVPRDQSVSRSLPTGITPRLPFH